MKSFHQKVLSVIKGAESTGKPVRARIWFGGSSVAMGTVSSQDYVSIVLDQMSNTGKVVVTQVIIATESVIAIEILP